MQSQKDTKPDKIKEPTINIINNKYASFWYFSSKSLISFWKYKWLIIKYINNNEQKIVSTKYIQILNLFLFGKFFFFFLVFLCIFTGKDSSFVFLLESWLFSFSSIEDFLIFNSVLSWEAFSNSFSFGLSSIFNLIFW